MSTSAITNALEFGAACEKSATTAKMHRSAKGTFTTTFLLLAEVAGAGMVVEEEEEGKVDVPFTATEMYRSI